MKTEYPKLWEYIKKGIEEGVDYGYNCRSRSPWYSCEVRQPSPLLLTYMGRSLNEPRMFRLILNNSRAIATNSYLLLYPESEYAGQLRNIDMLREVWRILNDIPKNELRKCGMVYGEGLYKIEPKELLNVPAPSLEDILGRESTLFG